MIQYLCTSPAFHVVFFGVISFSYLPSVRARPRPRALSHHSRSHSSSQRRKRMLNCGHLPLATRLDINPCKTTMVTCWYWCLTRDFLSCGPLRRRVIYIMYRSSLFLLSVRPYIVNLCGQRSWEGWLFSKIFRLWAKKDFGTPTRRPKVTEKSPSVCRRWT